MTKLFLTSNEEKARAIAVINEVGEVEKIIDGTNSETEWFYHDVESEFRVEVGYDLPSEIHHQLYGDESYRLIKDVNHCKNIGRYTLANSLCEILIKQLLDQDKNYVHERTMKSYTSTLEYHFQSNDPFGNDDEEDYYDLLVFTNSDAFTCIPVPLVDKVSLYRLMKRSIYGKTSKVVWRTTHDRQERDPTNEDLEELIDILCRWSNRGLKETEDFANVEEELEFLWMMHWGKTD